MELVCPKSLSQKFPKLCTQKGFFVKEDVLVVHPLVFFSYVQLATKQTESSVNPHWLGWVSIDDV